MAVYAKMNSQNERSVLHSLFFVWHVLLIYFMYTIHHMQ